jgi:hypothetical protein
MGNKKPKITARQATWLANHEHVRDFEIKSQSMDAHGYLWVKSTKDGEIFTHYVNQEGYWKRYQSPMEKLIELNRANEAKDETP